MTTALNRRDVLKTLTAAALLPLLGRITSAAESTTKPKRILFFTKASGYQHAVITRKPGEKYSFAENLMLDWAPKRNFEISCSKDGRIFDSKDIDGLDGFFFYTDGDLFTDGIDKNPPMTPQGKTKLLEMIKAGAGFAGLHSASNTFHSPTFKKRELLRDINDKGADNFDPYIQMLGGELAHHDKQQKTTLRCVDEKWPAAKAFKDANFLEEWYSLKNFAPDIHVILVQETTGMVGPMYQRAKYPCTWARMHEKGRVFYSSMGHREDLWQKEEFQELLFAGLNWTTGRIDAQLPANIREVTPDSDVKVQPPDPAATKPAAPAK
jgi:type 1 glutamine amidotransferase